MVHRPLDGTVNYAYGAFIYGLCGYAYRDELTWAWCMTRTRGNCFHSAWFGCNSMEPSPGVAVLRNWWTACW